MRASAAVAAFLCEEESGAMDRLERETACRVTVEPIEGSDLARLDVLASPSVSARSRALALTCYRAVFIRAVRP